MSIQHTNQHLNTSVIVNQHVSTSVNVNKHVNPTHQQTRQCISKRQPTCRFNTLTKTSMHQPININQLADSLHQRIADCASLHRMLIQDNQHVKTCEVLWVRSI